MNVAVCDPLQESLDSLKDLLLQMSCIKEVELYSNVKFFFEDLKEGSYYDVVLMGLNWEDEKNGIDYAQEIYEYNSHTKVVFMTYYTEEYIEHVVLKSSNMSGFLVKPVKIEMLEKVFDKICQQNKNTDGKLVIRHKGNVSVVLMTDIVYMESRLHKVNIILDKSIYQCNERLEQMLERVDDSFIQCHKSYVVNTKHISSYKRYEIILDTGTVIPISKKRYPDVKTYLDNIFL